MFGAFLNVKNSESVTKHDMDQLEVICKATGEEIFEQATQRGVSLVQLNGTSPSDVIVLLGRTQILVGFQKAQSQSTSVIYHADRNTDFSHDELKMNAQHHLGLSNMSILTVPTSLIGKTVPEVRTYLRDVISEFISEFVKRQNMPRAPIGYTHMQESLDRFMQDHPEFDRNVFVAMRFTETVQHRAIWSAISEELSTFGLTGLLPEKWSII